VRATYQNVKGVNENIPVEDIYYYITPERYKGKMPTFFTDKEMPGMAILKKNYPQIKTELEDYFNGNSSNLKVNFIPHNYTSKGWKTMPLYSYCLKRNDNCKKLPFTAKIIESIPGMSTAIVSVLEPGSTIKPHIGDTNAIARIHLGIKIPGGLPELGIRIGTTELTWKEGETFAFTVLKPHKAWNLTKERRIALLVDVVHEQYRNRRLMISGNVLAGFGMKYIASRIPMLKKMPKPLTMVIYKTLGFLAYLRLLFQKITGI